MSYQHNDECKREALEEAKMNLADMKQEALSIYETELGFYLDKIEEISKHINKVNKIIKEIKDYGEK